MKVLLVSPPWQLSGRSVYSKTGAIYPPLGIAYISAYIRDKLGLNVDILDARGLGMNYEQYGECLKKQNYDIIGFVAYTPTVIDVLNAAKIAKKLNPKVRIIVGGPHATLKTEELVSIPDIDIVVKGEGEETFRELLNALMNDQSIENIQGIAFIKEGKVQNNPMRPLIANLDDIPFPDRDKLPMHIYRPASGAYRRLPVTSIITSRGCPFQCSFCSKAIFGSKVRATSANRVIDEIQLLIRRYKIRELYFCDDSFTLNKERITEICERILSKNMDITWSCSTRVNLVDKDLLRLMRRAGCISIGYGIESGDPNMIKAIHKGITFTQIRDAVRWTREAQIETRLSYIFGFPGEDLNSMRKTLSFAKELNSDFVIFNLAIPLPGTEIYEIAKERQLVEYDGIELYKRCDGAQPLIKLSTISPKQLIDFYQKAYRSYYFRPRYILARLRTIKSMEDLKLNVKGFLQFTNWISQS